MTPVMCYRRMSLLNEIVNFTAINLDGCPELQSSYEGCRDSRQVEIMVGQEMNETLASHLSPFTGEFRDVAR